MGNFVNFCDFCMWLITRRLHLLRTQKALCRLPIGIEWGAHWYWMGGQEVLNEGPIRIEWRRHSYWITDQKATNTNYIGSKYNYYSLPIGCQKAENCSLMMILQVSEMLKPMVFMGVDFVKKSEHSLAVRLHFVISSFLRNCKEDSSAGVNLMHLFVWCQHFFFVKSL